MQLLIQEKQKKFGGAIKKMCTLIIPLENTEITKKVWRCIEKMGLK